MSKPVDITGVFAYPNESGNRDCCFIDTDYNRLFTVPDGGTVIVTDMGDHERALKCRYIDDAHIALDGTPYHIFQFAELQKQSGRVYRPEILNPGECCDTYAIYQLNDTSEAPYRFLSYEAAKDHLHPAHYRKAYQGMLAPCVALEDLWRIHNRDDRPFGRQMSSMSMSDIVVVNRQGKDRAFYVDRMGFTETDRFLRPSRNQPVKAEGRREAAPQKRRVRRGQNR